MAPKKDQASKRASSTSPRLVKDLSTKTNSDETKKPSTALHRNKDLVKDLPRPDPVKEAKLKAIKKGLGLSRSSGKVVTLEPLKGGDGRPVYIDPQTGKVLTPSTKERGLNPKTDQHSLRPVQSSRSASAANGIERKTAPKTSSDRAPKASAKTDPKPPSKSDKPEPDYGPFWEHRPKSDDTPSPKSQEEIRATLAKELAKKRAADDHTEPRSYKRPSNGRHPLWDRSSSTKLPTSQSSLSEITRHPYPPPPPVRTTVQQLSRAEYFEKARNFIRDFERSPTFGQYLKYKLYVHNY